MCNHHHHHNNYSNQYDYYDYYGCPRQATYYGQPVAFSFFPFGFFNYSSERTQIVRAPPKTKTKKPAQQKAQQDDAATDKSTGTGSVTYYNAATNATTSTNEGTNTGNRTGGGYSPADDQQHTRRATRVKEFQLESIALVIGWLETIIMTILFILVLVFAIISDRDVEESGTSSRAIALYVGAGVCLFMLLLACMLLMGLAFGRNARCLMVPWLIVHALLLLPFFPIALCMIAWYIIWELYRFLGRPLRARQNPS